MTPAKLKEIHDAVYCYVDAYYIQADGASVTGNTIKKHLEDCLGTIITGGEHKDMLQTVYRLFKVTNGVTYADGTFKGLQLKEDWVKAKKEPVPVEEVQ